MYGMDVNPLAYKFHLEDLEREAAALRESTDQATPEMPRERRWPGTEILRTMPFNFLERRKARTT